MFSFASLEAQRRKQHASRRKRKRDRKGDSSESAETGEDESFGVLHLAIQKDLLEVGNSFRSSLNEKRIALESDDQNQQSRICGAAFGCFREVAQATKLQRLHCFVPPRCDAGSFSQLLYAACLDLLDAKVLCDNTPGSGSDSVAPVLENNAYAIFSLYLLHETNPLPVAPAAADQASVQLKTLPMGCTNRANPRLIFRRNFRPPIRVDPATFSKLLQLHALSEGSTDIVAADLKLVLNRLWPNVSLASYTGPAGLMGLAQRQLHDSTSSPSQSAQDASTGQRDEQTDSQYTGLKTKMDLYLEDCSRLRLPPPNTNQRFDRIRMAMQPMAGRNEIKAWEGRLRGVLGGELSSDPTSFRTKLQRPAGRVVTFALPSGGKGKSNNENSTAGPEMNEGGASDSVSKADDAAPSESFDLVLPSDIPKSLRSSLESAVQTLLNRYDSAIFQCKQGPSEEAGDVSTLASNTIANSSVGTASAVGRGALNALIAQAVGAEPLNPTKTTVAKKTSFLESLDDVVDQDGRTRKGRGKKLNPALFDGEISDVSSDEATNLGSVGGGSSVGRRALEDLLMEASKVRQRPRKRAPKPGYFSTKQVEAGKKKKAAIRTRKRKSPVPEPVDEADGTEADASTDGSDAEDEDEDILLGGSARDEDGSISGRGQAALEALLSKVC